MKHPFSVYFLTFLLLFLSLGGFYGGFSMLVDPSGNLIQMAPVLPALMVPDFTLPGLFLLTVMGLFPLFLSIGILFKPDWPVLTSLSRWSGYYWAFTGSVILGLVLAGWLILQALLIGFQWPVQWMTAGNCLLILVVAWLPGVRNRYREVT